MLKERWKEVKKKKTHADKKTITDSQNVCK